MRTVEEVVVEIYGGVEEPTLQEVRDILRSYAQEIREECAKTCEQWRPDGSFYARAIRSLEIK